MGGSHHIRKFSFPSVDRPLVKICGLTRVDNALDCVKAGADIIGLVFYEKSPRNISFDRAGQITGALPSHVPGCGVFVDATYERVMETVENCGLKMVQLHGNEPPELAARLSSQGLMVVKAFFAAREPGLDRISQYPDIDFFLAEYGKGPLPGGNAETWDYGLAATADSPTPLMLAGGLSPENVAKAVSRANPVAVDASSSLEAGPGEKDIQKVAAFIRAAKSAGPA